VVDVLEPQTLFAKPALLAGMVRPMLPADVWEQQILSAHLVPSALAGNIGVLDVPDQLTPSAHPALLVTPININVFRALPHRTDYAKIALRPQNVRQIINMRKYMAFVAAPVGLPLRDACLLGRLYVRHAQVKQVAILVFNVMDSNLMGAFGVLLLAV
jgi:hypothetical protein